MRTTQRSRPPALTATHPGWSVDRGLVLGAVQTRAAKGALVEFLWPGRDTFRDSIEPSASVWTERQGANIMGTQSDSAFLTLLFVGGTVALLCAFISGYLAKSKNHDFTNWFCLGLLLGPIGLIAAAVSPMGQPHAPRGMVPKSCPRCNARQNIPATSSEYECWQCKTKTSVKC